MPERPLTIATYAAGASLAAITLVYVFGPTFFLDHEEPGSQKRGAVGLTNYANDCFINSILQALAGLPDLRKYLIREVHRRKLDGIDVYSATPDEITGPTLKSREITLSKLESLRQGIVTHALKDVLDNLNERPIARKTISAQGFIAALEHGFRSRISRQQQDAHEFLQLVTERLRDEYHAGRKARARARRFGLQVPEIGVHPDVADGETKQGEATEENEQDDTVEDVAEDGFPFEGKLESHIECQTCGFKPKPAASQFVIFTLNVPQTSITTLNRCFDGMFKVENIDDYKCDRCRLEHAIAIKEHELSRTDPESARHSTLTSEISRLNDAIITDPENPPPDVPLPDRKHAPKRRIQRHSQISHHPKILAIHLSRSIYSMASSTKNLAKVHFPETLSLGSLLDVKTYRLLTVVTHKGGHNSGHYESFRRQIASIPFSTSVTFGAEGAYSRAHSPSLSHAGSPHSSALPSVAQSPKLGAVLPATNSDTTGTSKGKDAEDAGISLSPLSPGSVPQRMKSPSLSSVSSRESIAALRRPAPTSTPRDMPSVKLVSDESGSSETSATGRPSTSRSILSRSATATPESAKRPQRSASQRLSSAHAKRKAKKRDAKWWRISDEKVKECKTSDVLGMQKEVYLLFYELMTD
ncbi:cysteine proteinase, partial [Eremomyces bilateralis CBS 781.70]